MYGFSTSREKFLHFSKMSRERQENHASVTMVMKKLGKRSDKNVVSPLTDVEWLVNP